MFARALLTFMLFSGAQACFFLDLPCKAAEKADSVGKSLTGQARDVFNQAMDHVFDEDINPLIDKVQASIPATADKVAAEVNATADHITTAINSIIEDAGKTASALADNVTKDIEKIISDGSAAVHQAEKVFFKDASKLLAKVNAIVDKLLCGEVAVAKQIQDTIRKALQQLNPFYRVSSCWRGLGYSVTRSLEDLTEVELYNYQKTCTLLNKITPTTPIHGPNGILQIYAQGQLYASQYYCIGETAHSPAFEDVFTKEWVWWGVQYNSWNKLLTEPAGRLGKTKDDPCNTPVECYQQAIKKLAEARAEIQDKASESELSDLSTKVNDLQISEECRDDYTPAGPNDSGDFPLVYLSWHDPKCHDDERMVQLQWKKVEGTSGSMYVQYRCCKMTVLSNAIVV